MEYRYTVYLQNLIDGKTALDTAQELGIEGDKVNQMAYRLRQKTGIKTMEQLMFRLGQGDSALIDLLELLDIPPVGTRMQKSEINARPYVPLTLNQINR